MRTWFILLGTVITLTIIVITENIIINDFKADALSCITDIKNNINEVKIDDLDELEGIWNRRKNTIYMFLNHNSFSNVESSIDIMEECIKTQNIDELRFRIAVLENCIKSIAESSSLSIENIL